MTIFDSLRFPITDTCGEVEYYSLPKQIQEEFETRRLPLIEELKDLDASEIIREHRHRFIALLRQVIYEYETS